VLKDFKIKFLRENKYTLEQYFNSVYAAKLESGEETHV